MRRAFLLSLFMPLAAPALAHEHPSRLRPPVIGLMRHGGTLLADPAEAAKRPACDPHRILPDEGREEMRRLGARLRDEGLDAARLLASRQCNAWETAELLALGPVAHLPVLDPYPSEEAALRRPLLRRALLAAGESDMRTIFVTQRANIADLTGIQLPKGHILLLRAEGGRLTMAGRITSG